MNLPTLDTDRTRLRPLVADDLEAMFAIFSDPRSMRHWSEPPHVGLERTRALLGSIVEPVDGDNSLTWGIERKRDETLIGTVTLMLAHDQPRAELGYILGSEHWGQGYAGESQRTVIAYAFEELALTRLEADVDPANAASVRSLERLGFTHEGLLRERWTVAGEVTDSAFYGLLAREWKRAQACFDEQHLDLPGAFDQLADLGLARHVGRGSQLGAREDHPHRLVETPALGAQLR